jgi:NosR/NirI family nitrous oxide reductase transcriptional regulator
MNPLAQYTRWIHTRWPAGLVEKLPEVGEDGRTAVPGLRVVGDLTGIPLLKFSADTGAKAVQAILREPGFKPGALPDGHDLIIVGGGVSGVSAALEAKAAGLRYLLLEASEPFNTIVNFPKGKPIYTYPSDMTPAGKLSFRADVKEGLLEELEAQRKAGGVEARSGKADRVERRGDALVVHVAGGEPLTAQRVIVAIGRSGNYRRLGVPGEDLDKVYNRLHDPAELAGQEVLVVGGGDSALEAAVALDAAGAKVTLSYRKPELARPKPDNVEALAVPRG